MIWLLSAILVLAFAVVGIVTGTFKLVDTVPATACTWDDTNIKMTAFLNNVLEPMNTLETDFNIAVTRMQDSTTFPPNLVDGVEDLESQLADIATKADAAGTAARTNWVGASFPQACEDAWDEISSKATDAETATNKQAQDLNWVLRDIQNSINDAIVGQKDEVNEKIDVSKTAIVDMRTTFEDTLSARPALNIAKLARQHRHNAAFSQWGNVFVAIVLALIGIPGMAKCHKEANYEPNGQGPRSNPNLSGSAQQLTTIGGCCARFTACSWCIMLSFGTLGAMFAVLFMPLTVVMHDACQVLPDLPGRLGELTGNTMVQNISDTCWTDGANLFDGFGLRSMISTDSIDFGDIEKSREDPDISEDGLVALIHLLDTMRDNSQQCYDKANTNGTVDDLRTAIAQGRTHVEWVKGNFSADPTAENIANAGKEVVGALDDAICQFKEVSTCFFVRQTWDSVSDLICENLNGSLANMALYQLLVAIMAIPYAIALLLVNRRCGGHGPIKIEENEYAVDTKEIQAIELADGAYYT